MSNDSYEGRRIQGKHILLVEDDFSSRMLLEKVLVYYGATVMAVDNGEPAVAYVLGGNHVDLVILDIQLPRMDGYTVFNKIKEFSPSIPIFAQTAYVYSNESENVIALGFDEYFPKPIDINLLLDKISAIKTPPTAIGQH